MPRLTRKSSKAAGSSPGTLVHVGEKKTETIHLTMLHYDADILLERSLDRVEEALPLIKPATTTWINIDGVHDTVFMADIGRQYGIHPLTLEDVLNTHQRPKAEAFDDYLYVVMKMLSYDADKDRIRPEQISLILGKHVLISFQEAARRRVRTGAGTDS